MNPGGLLAWVRDIGPYTETMMTRMLDAAHNFHREVRWRAARGLRRLGDKYPDERIEAACRRALHFGSKSYLNVKRILEHGLDRQPIADEVPCDDAPIEHDQVRGPEYYQ